MPNHFGAVQHVELAAPLALAGRRQLNLLAESADPANLAGGVPTIIGQSLEFLVKVAPAARNVPLPQVISGTTVEFAPVFTKVFLNTA
jgi:hypothetical protein